MEQSLVSRIAGGSPFRPAAESALLLRDIRAVTGAGALPQIGEGELSLSLPAFAAVHGFNVAELANDSKGIGALREEVARIEARTLEAAHRILDTCSSPPLWKTSSFHSAGGRIAPADRSGALRLEVSLSRDLDGFRVVGCRGVLLTATGLELPLTEAGEREMAARLSAQLESFRTATQRELETARSTILASELAFEAALTVAESQRFATIESTKSLVPCWARKLGVVIAQARERRRRTPELALPTLHEGNTAVVAPPGDILGSCLRIDLGNQVRCYLGKAGMCFRKEIGEWGSFEQQVADAVALQWKFKRPYGPLDELLRRFGS